jgi:glycosyltransferase involved in cell wall biosynthesis
MKAAILYLTYNRLEYTKKSLQSIIDNTPRDLYDLLLWDNGSQDEGVLEYLRETCVNNKFEYVFAKENLGLTTAMNWQMKIKSNGYDVFCHIANDVVVPENWLDGVFKAIQSDKVGLVGLNLENGEFEKENVGEIELERLRPECNVGGMHFCIPKKVFDLIGYFQPVKCGYGQQDADYSLSVKLLPNDWWVYYLPLELYKGTHLGPLNFQLEGRDLYPKYHEWMFYRLKASGNDESGGRNYRRFLEQQAIRMNNKEITIEEFIGIIRVMEQDIQKVRKDQILETSLDLGNFE